MSDISACLLASPGSVSHNFPARLSDSHSRIYSPRYAELVFYTLSFGNIDLSKPFSDHAVQNKLTPFISMQNHYSLVYREEEREMMPTLKHFGVGSIPWSPLARGFLTRSLTEQIETKRSESDWYVKPTHAYRRI